MSENTEKMTLKELEKQFQEMRERYEEKIRDLETRLTEKAELPPAAGKKKHSSDWLNEEVPCRLFKDSDRYKDDVTVGINGKLVKVRRGEIVKIKRKYLMLIEDSKRQDEKTAAMMDRESRRFETESRVYDA